MSDKEQEIDEWIDGLLTSPKAMPEAPQTLRADVRRAVGRQARVRLSRRLVAAAAVVVALIYWPRGERVTEPNQLAGAPSALQEKSTEPVAKFIAGDDTIAVEIKSSAPNVTILQVYPTLSAQSHREREALLKRTLTSTSYDGG